MQKLKEHVLRTVVKAVEKEVRSNENGWPPPCIGFIYQPKRLEKRIKEEKFLNSEWSKEKK